MAGIGPRNVVELLLQIIDVLRGEMAAGFVPDGRECVIKWSEHIDQRVETAELMSLGVTGIIVQVW